MPRSAPPKRKQKTFIITLSSVYHPNDEKEQDDFNTFLDTSYSRIPKNTLFMSGQDMNASLGTSKKKNDCLGQFGLSRKNSKGTNARNLLNSHRLKAPNTHFKHNNYTTWTSFDNTHSQFTLDHWIRNDLRFISDSKFPHLESTATTVPSTSL